MNLVNLVGIFTVFVFLASFAECGLNELCYQIDYYRKGHFPLCLEYDDYGCWCGPGGSGAPVDKVDECCMGHDHCYDGILANGTCDPYLAQYHWDDGECLDATNTCLFTLCNCDQTLAKCVSGKTYHRQFYGWRLFHTCK